ncbi:unnamed protein product [Microthlaspi erraticum]|uniref:Uncharacterized protein n=1 Tax=Microthlaspi erraticum TaxID=1685480 RepID=A0A6D2I2F9_9BRAS|nr:unnamed protein product [Microthlaspi erraticum]
MRLRCGGVVFALSWRTGTLVEGRLGLPKFILLGAFRAKVWSLGAAKEEVFRLQRDQEKAKDVDAMVADLKLDKLALEGKIAALNKEIMKTIGLQDRADKLRAQVGDLEEKARRDAEASAAEMERLRRSRRDRSRRL